MNSIQGLCMMCRDKNHSTKLDKLKRLQRICAYVEANNDRINRPTFMWNLYFKCRYGMPCSHLKKLELEAKLIATQLEPYLITIALTDEHTYHEVLELLRGDFPSVYQTIRLIHTRNKQSQP